MLIQLPGGPKQPGVRDAESDTPFEAGLRRDLASAQMVSYDAVLGGWPKRAIDLTLVLLSLPLWLPIMLGAAAWAKLRHSAPVFQVRECVGYGGRSFKCLSLRFARPSAMVERLRLPGEPEQAPANDLSAIADKAEGRHAKWRRSLERLPQLINVIAGDMALVGPQPLSRAELEPLKSPRRYYLSARPGVVGISAIVNADHEEPSHYKIYAMSWALSTDALILWDALHSLRQRGELWRPGFKLAKDVKRAQTSVGARRRSGT